jgi:3-phenylpropionate/trans-cinnamate dioxygenase ferredoxin reductase subunit
MCDPRTFVIAGAGQAGRWVAWTLRSQGFAGRLVWFGDEAHRPYERPPLSKAVLKGEAGLDRLMLIQEAQWNELAPDWRPGQRVTSIDRAARTVETDRGETVNYDALFLALGGVARTLPGLNPHPRVLTLRTWEDAVALKGALGAARRVLVLGGGWIGLEVAASARTLGCEVTVVEAVPRLCQRTVPPCVSEHLLAAHRTHGVEVRLGDAVRQVAPGDDGVTLTLAGGAVLQGDLLVVGIGLIANDQLAGAAGLAVGNGIHTDALGRTADPAIYAVGDCANALRANGARVRIESWENAQRQAIGAAKTALGLTHDDAADGPPWFWSDQYDDNLQLLGEPTEAMRVVERQVPAKRSRLFFFCEGARVRAVAAVNAGRDIRVVRKWISQDRYPSLEAIVDPAADLNKLPVTAPA